LDHDPQRFISYLVAALSERFPGLRAPMQPLLNNLRSIEQDLEEVIVTLTNELYSQVEEDFLLIIDDFHLLDGYPLVALILNRFLQLTDDNCHVILATRTLPELPDLMLMVAREQTEGLDQSELAFRPDEIQALFKQTRGEALTEQSAQQLCEQSGGWITGITLSERTNLPHITGVDTFTYLGRQVLDQQPKPLQEFMLRTSLPEEFNAEMCEAILGQFTGRRKNWSSTINSLIEKNLFILRVGAGGDWIRYHPLFRDFLRSRLVREHPEDVIPVLDKLTQFYEVQCEWEKAYFTCQQLNDPERLAQLVEHAGTHMMQHAFTTLEGWVSVLPPHLVSTRPGLISLRGAMAIMRGNVREAINLLNTAEPVFRLHQDIENLSLLLTRRASAYRQMGKYELALEHAEEVMTLTHAQPRLQATYAEALRIKGLSLFRLGHSREAIDYLEQSLSLFRTLNEAGSIPLLLMETGVAHAAIGNLEAARSAYEKALKIWQGENNLSQQADVLNNIANLHHQAGEYERAVVALDRGLTLARRSRYTRGEALILLSLGDVYVDLGDYESASQAYERTQPIADQWPGAFIDNYLILARANLAVVQQDIRNARAILQRAQKRLQDNASLYERGLRALIEGRVQLLAKQPGKAVEDFSESKQCFTHDGRETETAWSRIWLSAAYSETGNAGLAGTELLELLGSGKNPSHGTLIMVAQAESWLKALRADPKVGGSLNSLMEKALRLQNKLPAIRRSVRRLTESIEMPGPGLVIRAFGRGEVQVNGKMVTSSEWSTQSVRDLFFFFLCRGMAVTKEQVAAALWPEEMDPQVIKQRFKTYLFRLRRATRRDVVIFDEEYYQFNFGLDYEYDIEAFETYLARARATKDVNEQIDNYRKAIVLVRGPYLEGTDMPWALGERERLEQVYIGALMELSELQFSNRQLREAGASAQRALEVDPYREEVHRILMRVYAASMDRPAIRRQYQLCKVALTRLGLIPSMETQRLYEELIR
jgi:ATP/maltotriose-dependent transcriptional regulator MalT/two-component SAPR family response regulator